LQGEQQRALARTRTDLALAGVMQQRRPTGTIEIRDEATTLKSEENDAATEDTDKEATEGTRGV